MVLKGRCIAADRQSASRECISPARSQNICIVCVCLSSAARERKHKQLMVGRWWSDGGRRVCVCVGEAMGEADGQGGGLATFKEKKKVLYFLF